MASRRIASHRPPHARTIALARDPRVDTQPATIGVWIGLSALAAGLGALLASVIAAAQ